MKYLIILFIILLLRQISFSQDVDKLFFIHSMENKEFTTFEDAVSIFIVIQGSTLSDYETNLQSLIVAKILDRKEYSKEMILKRGLLSLMIASYLDLEDSLLFYFFRTERYAFNTCVSYDIMDNNQSEWDKISGLELIEIMSIVIDKKRDLK